MICLRCNDGSQSACWVHKCHCALAEILSALLLCGLICIFISFTFFKITCVEQQLLLDPQSNPLFTPVPVMEGVTPLEDCVLSFSQFTGAERDSLVYLAELLGARYVSCHHFFMFLASVMKSIMYFISCFTGVTIFRIKFLLDSIHLQNLVLKQWEVII